MLGKFGGPPPSDRVRNMGFHFYNDGNGLALDGRIGLCDDAGAQLQKKIWECAYKTAGVATPADICAVYKSDANGPYSCTPVVPSGDLPTTIAEALTYYETNYDADAICAPLKDNAPFQCSGTEQKSYFEIVSLSYSNAEMVFGLLGSFIVLVLYKCCKRAKDPDALDEDTLMKRLDALEADNKRLDALEAFVAGLRG